jgi:hypothetical protein
MQLNPGPQLSACGSVTDIIQPFMGEFHWTTSQMSEPQKTRLAFLTKKEMIK